MKKVAVGILALMLAVAVVLLWSRSVRNHRSEIQEVNTTEEIRVPATVKEQPTQPVPSAAKPAAPFRVSFEASATGKLGEAIPVSIVVAAADPETLPAGLVGEEVTLEYLLRLPHGVQLKSDGWTPVALPAEEENDSAGVWSLFERKRTLTTPADSSAAEWAREKVELAVVEKGTNWIITTRARLTWGSLSFQTFGVIFATVDANGRAELHAAPRTIQTEQRAQAN